MNTNAISLLMPIAVCLWGCHGNVEAQPQHKAAGQVGIGAEPSPSYAMVDSKLGASLIKIAVPAKWNKDVLIFAHGLRAASSPLIADFSTDDAMFKALIGEGWMIASTSYRRNGYIVEEAIDDIDQLRQHVIDTYGLPKRVFLAGASMGGAIATRMAETHEGKYAGMLVVGPALAIGKNPYSFTPRMPLLMMSNQSEVADPNAYAKRAAQAAIKPARWIVKRDGHCNVTSEEMLCAFRAVIAWSETGAIELERDGTIVPQAPPSVAVFGGGSAIAKVTHVASGRGSCDTEFTAADLAKLEIPLRSRFQVTCKDKTVTVLYGTTYGDVPKGGWVAFVVAEGGHLRIARNYADAVTVLGCAVGDMISITPLKKDEQ